VARPREDIVVHEEHALAMTGGRELAAQRWVPNGRPRAALALVHGFGEHTGRYTHVGEWLARAGYALCAVDLPGHGRTKGKRGCTSREELLQVTDLLLADAKARFRGVPVFLYGHSLGAAIVLLHVMTRPPAAAGVIATSPLLRLAGKPPAAKVAAARVLARLLPSFTMRNPLDMTALSSDPSVGEAASRDPLYHNTVSVRLGWEIMEWGQWFEGQSGPFPLPLLLLLGTGDRIVDTAAVRQFAGRLTGDVTLREWDGLFHELHNEPEKDQVLAFLVSWLGRHGA
jgi:alpha-beta hydrolase superfamily lysophospholipase